VWFNKYAAFTYVKLKLLNKLLDRLFDLGIIVGLYKKITV